LWLLLGLFVLRVMGQALVAFLDVEFLPPMEAWYSGLMPYEVLLPSQIVIVAVMAKISPIVFHWVLAAFVITLGLSHRRRLRQ
jgi:hypothetical protein